MEIGYARTSTLEQKAGLEAQIRDLKAAGVEKIFWSSFPASTPNGRSLTPRSISSAKAMCL